MIKKTDTNMPVIREKFSHFRSMGPTPASYINDKVLADMMLADEALQYVGGAGSCAGCGEASVLRMFIAATCYKYGPENVGLIAATGCNTVYTSTYPYNPYKLPWSNSLFENAPTFAMGVRAKWDQQGWDKKRLWVIGGDGAMMDIGFQSLSRMLMSGMDIKVIVLDTQVYSNTGGQASTSTFMGQNTKMSVHGKEIAGKTERRKELAQIVMAHPEVFVAQTTAAHVNHFYKAVLGALEFDGGGGRMWMEEKIGTRVNNNRTDEILATGAEIAAVACPFCTIMIEDGLKHRNAEERVQVLDIAQVIAKSMVRVHKGNPVPDKDWYVDPKTGERVDFVTFARGEGRFEKQFDANGIPSPTMLLANEDRRRNWRMLQEMAGIEPEAPPAPAPAAAGGAAPATAAAPTHA